MPRYEVEFLRDIKTKGRGFQYLVHWLGYPNEEDEWVNASELRQNSPDLVAEFHTKYPLKPRPMAPNEIRQLSFRPIPPPLTELDITYPDGIYLGEPVPHDERNGDPKNRIHTDAIITILPQHLANIVSQQKNHEYRKY